jgi:hypothetical protein
MVNREAVTQGCPYWDHPVNRVNSDEVELRFIDFFDWDQAGFVDFQYYLVRVESSSKYPQIVGHRALVEVGYAKVFSESPNLPEA